MRDYRSLCHSRWDCKYHVVFIPKRRKKRIYGHLRRHAKRLPAPERVYCSGNCSARRGMTVSPVQWHGARSCT